jgi:hypothetical protein
MSNPGPAETDIKYLESVVGALYAEDVAWVLYDTGNSVRDDAAVSEALALIGEVG